MNIVERPMDLEFRPCTHRPTQQEFCFMTVAGSVETLHGTMTFRPGDALMIGADKKTLYVLTAESFAAAYTTE